MERVLWGLLVYWLLGWGVRGEVLGLESENGV